MKNNWNKIIVVLLLVLFMVNCSVNKNKNNNSLPITPKIEEPIVDKFIDTSKIGFNFFEDSDSEKKWVDSVYSILDLKEKIGQLMVIPAYSNRDETHFKELDKLIEEYKVGGILFLQGSAVKQAKLTNRLQAKSKVPLFITIDAEWGLNMRLDSTYKYPFNMTLGAIRDLKLIEKMGENMGRECKQMGIHFNFSPVLDINTNPNNPIIGYRSFGENKYEVTRRAIALMKGIQNQGILATGKHFPGHGDTEVDSHVGLPVLRFDRNRLDDIEMYPYKPVFDKGLQSVMVAHLHVPVLEPRDKYPTSLSYKVVTELLQEQMGFKGLIFTDGLNMKGASNFLKSGDLEIEAILAGNDVLLNPENVPIAYEKLKKAYEDTLITDSRLEHSVKKILKYKYKAGLNKYKPINTDKIVANINPIENTTLQYQLYEKAVTVVKNENAILPIKDLSNSKIAYIKLGDASDATFIATLSKYNEIKEINTLEATTILDELKDFNTVIISYHKSDMTWWKKHEFTAKELELIDLIAINKNVILDVFAKPYVLSAIKSFDSIESIIVSYQNGDIAQEVSAEIIFGAVGAKGRLPVSIGTTFQVNDGLDTEKLNILGFSTPESVNMSTLKLNEIEGIANKAINGKMTPGMQILVARKGKVIYQKSFGYHAYDKKTKVKNTDIYDIASITKIASTLPNVMKLYDQGKVTFETKLGDMLPIFQQSDKNDITFNELLSHYGRLQAWEPFYKSTIDIEKCPTDQYYRFTYTKDFTKQVFENLYIRDDYQDTIMKKIVNSKLLEKKEYKYSDFTFIILKDYVEKMTGKSLDVLSDEEFFKPLGMSNTMYNPLRKYDMNMIPPTDDDDYFRHTRIQGYVHDMAAAMQGGVGGHAGVFSNSMDIAKLMQMYLQKGTYGDKKYFSPEIFDVFNTCHFCPQENRRGLGFDKPQLGIEGPTCGCLSKSSFGHTGFTGTIAWADPESEIIYVFLSNRTFPDSNAPNRLSKENIREDIQKIIQEAIIN